MGGCVCIASSFSDCSIYIGHKKGCPWRVEGSGRWEELLFVPPCESERKFGKVYKAAWPEYMAYVVNQTMIVADLIKQKCRFTVGRQRRETYPRRNELAVHDVEVTIKMFQTKVDVIHFAPVSGEKI